MKTFTQTSITLAMMMGLTAGAIAGDPKAGAPAQPAKEKAPEAAKKMEMPKPPTEIAEMAKMAAGNWKCTGKAAMDPTDLTKMADMKMTMTMKLDLGKWWIKGDMNATGGMGFKGTMYTTFDPLAKKWIRLMVDSMGGSETATSTGMKDNKVVWDGEARSPMPGMAAMKTRTTEQMSAKETTLIGEGSMDGGKTWFKGWEASCKK
jgi:hypothetical protein